METVPVMVKNQEYWLVSVQKLRKKQRLVDFEFTREQSAVHEFFYVRTWKIFAKNRRSADFNYKSSFFDCPL